MSMIIHKYDLPNIDIDTSSFIYEGNYILIQDEYISDVLKCMNVPEINDDHFQYICDLGCFKNYPEVLELYALETPHNAYYYARYALDGRFELGEPIIATSMYYNYRYARYVLRGRFELGEQIIATDAKYSYLYASDVLKCRFELGEKTIASNSYYSYYYSTNVLKGRFELGEEIIATEADYGYHYALVVLKG